MAKFIFLGITQGLSEFLPISSSGHLYTLKRVFEIGENLFPFFLLLHLASLLAIGVVLHKEIRSALSNRNLLIQLGIITAVTFVFGFFIDYFLKWIFEVKFFISFCFLVNGVILLSITKKHMKRESQDIQLKDSLLLGVLQALAIFPGISRSGITIACMLRRGFHIRETFSFSFLMAIPAILGAFLLKSRYIFNSGAPNYQVIFGFIAAFIASLIALKLVRRTLLHHRFAYFGYYCLIVSVVGLFL